MTASNNDVFVSLVGAAVCAIVVFAGLSIWGRQRGLELLSRWATSQGFVLVSARRRSFVPYWSSESGQGYQFFRVTVRNRDGVLRNSWIRCSDLTWHDPTKIDVIWDDKPTKRTSA